METRYETSWGIFEWDSEKEAANILKHGINFYQAAEVFADPFCRFIDDIEHSIGESRTGIIGRLATQPILIYAVFTERKAIRIISARKATNAELKEYENDEF